jgi:hypothetical protein
MKSEPSSTVIAARIEPRHAAQLRELADANLSTVSRLVACAVADAIDGTNRMPSLPQPRAGTDE